MYRFTVCAVQLWADTTTAPSALQLYADWKGFAPEGGDDLWREIVRPAETGDQAFSDSGYMEASCSFLGAKLRGFP